MEVAEKKKLMMVPKLRFREFDGEWNEHILEAICKKKISYGIVQAGDHIYGGMPYIKSTDLNEEIDALQLQRTSDEIAKKYRRSEVNPGDIVFSLRGNIGVSKIVPENLKVANLTQGTARISVNPRFNNRFVYQTIQTADLQKKVLRVSKGSTFQEISLADLRRVKVNLPYLSEQKKIADFLSAVDARIKHLNRKKELLEQYKKGVMQQLFSQELRFKRPDGTNYPDWEEKRLGEIFKERNTQAPKSEEYPLMAFIAGQGVAPKGDRYNREFLVNDGDGKKYKQTEYGDFIYSSNNLLTGSIGLNKYGSACISPVYSIFKIKETAVTEFVSSYLVRKIALYRMVRFRQGVVYGQWRIHESEFLKIKDFFPSKEEQQKIADFLSALDTKIEAVSTQIAKTQQFKKGLLQKMFV